MNHELENTQEKADLWFGRASRLSSELAFILKGLRSGSIRSKPIIDLSNLEAESLEPETLEDHIQKALISNGFALKAQS